MKFCEKHWTAIREAVRARGLGHLISATGRDAVARTMAELQGKAEPDDFDPLMSVTWMIYGKGVQYFPYLMFGPEPERGLPDCPICEAVRRHPTPCPHGCTAEAYERWWIDGPADAALQLAREKGLVAA